MGTFAADDVLINFGPHTVDGLVTGSFVTIDRAGPSFKKQIGSKGEVSRARLLDRSGTVKIKLQQSSLSNDYLSGLLQTDESGGGIPLPLEIDDMSGASVFKAALAWIEKPPSVGYGTDMGEREWTIECGDIQMTVGGVVNP